MRGAPGPAATAIDSGGLEALVSDGGTFCDGFVDGSHLGSPIFGSSKPPVRRAVPRERYVIAAVEKHVVAAKIKHIIAAKQRSATSPTSIAKGGIVR